MIWERPEVQLSICVFVFIVGGYVFTKITPQTWILQFICAIVMSAAMCFVWPPPDGWVLPATLYTMTFVFFVTLRVAQSYINEEKEVFYEVDSSTIDAFFDDN